MNRTMQIVLALAAAVFAAAWTKAAENPAPKQHLAGNLVTRWAKQVDPANPLPEYPRPQMVRKQWQNLNGGWDYAVTAKDAARPTAFDGKIVVPFPIESTLSGVRRALSGKEWLWYRRTFAAPSLDGGKRLILNFGAVDWEAVVSVNGKQIGTHRGGYDPFSFDITDAVKPGPENELVVRVWDSTGANGEPKGKQHFAAMLAPGGIMYTPCSGIWQTVWLETVPACSVESLKIAPDLDHGQAQVTVKLRGDTTGRRILVQGSGEASTQIIGASGKPGEPIAIKIPAVRAWTPDSPYLYDLEVLVVAGQYNSAAEDTVKSYFGMRKVSLGKDAQGVTRPMLNNKFVFQSGPLDQGFWPDGIYTAPTDEALRFDVEITKKLGFNMTRKHVKVEPARWYYWCDKLGLLVWQDMPSGGGGRQIAKDQDGVPASPERAKQFEAELKAMVESNWNHPSIILWVVFNEGWGQYDTMRLTNWVKELDPSRLTNNASGWTDRKVGDVIDMHAYPGPNTPAWEPTRAAVLGEFGGLGLGLDNHKWVDKNWGYRGVNDQRDLTRKYLDLWRKVFALRDEKGLSAAVYTQITDVETECNGLLTYDRAVVKVDQAQAFAALVKGEFPAALSYKTVVGTAAEGPATWRYTLKSPMPNWYQTAFDDSKWSEGKAGFGTAGTPGAIVGTEWKTPDIWLRRTVDIPQGARGELMLRVHHDEDAQIYINGALAAQFKGFTSDYEETAIAPAALKTIKPGKNHIAVHCKQTKGGQFIDVGIVEVKQ